MIGATENLPSGDAVKPGDIVRALDGTTIEVNNTDAEGRLVLADCIAYARREGAERLVDVATLTGGDRGRARLDATRVCSRNDDALGRRASRRGRHTGELVWRLPLHPRVRRDDQGPLRRARNSPPSGRKAAPITAAEFLHHFAGDVPWAHLDIAGTA